MTVAEMRKKYGGMGGSIAIAVPSERGTNGFVREWSLLQIVHRVVDVAKAIRYYEEEGFIHVAPIPLDSGVELKEELAARYCRVFFDRNYLARFVLYADEL